MRTITTTITLYSVPVRNSSSSSSASCSSRLTRCSIDNSWLCRGSVQKFIRILSQKADDVSRLASRSLKKLSFGQFGRNHKNTSCLQLADVFAPYIYIYILYEYHTEYDAYDTCTYIYKYDMILYDIYIIHSPSIIVVLRNHIT